MARYECEGIKQECLGFCGALRDKTGLKGYGSSCIVMSLGRKL